jgi:predicted nucleotidyltransferase
MSETQSTPYVFEHIDRRTKKVTPALISAVAQRIVQIIKPTRLVLFGSQAGSKIRPNSDIDLLICLPDHHPLASKRRVDRSAFVLDLFRYRSFSLDVILLTESEIQHLVRTNEGEWDLILEILDKGKTLYECANPRAAQ